MKETRKSLVENIHGLLSIYKNFIDFQNSSGLFDINKECENIFCGLLNNLYGTNLHNLNVKYNYPAIDLGDESSGICFQITSDNSSQKVKHTLEIFEKYMLNTIYSDLYILILGIKGGYNKINIPEYAHIIDFNDIAITVNNCTNYGILMSIREHLENELTIKGLIIPRDSNVLIQIEPSQIKYGQGYLKGFFAGIDEAGSNDTDDINCFAKEISLLPEELRNLIYIATTRCQIRVHHFHFYNHIFFDNARLNTLYHYDSHITDLLRQLISSGNLDYEVIEDQPNIYAFKFLNRGKDYDIYGDIVKYCEEKGFDLKEIIINLNFSILD
jgi:hypothetical protein